jgi:hypothetical protein
MHEVRSTTDRQTVKSEAKPSLSAKQCQGWGAWRGWRWDVWKCMQSNQGYLGWCVKEQPRSQNPHSSDEAGNDRGAKGGRKVEP